MNIIGLNFNKIFARKQQDLKPPFSINTNIEITSVEKNKIEFIGNQDTMKLSFSFVIDYEEKDKREKKRDANDANSSQVAFLGEVIASVNPEESKNILKMWKKKEIPPQIKFQVSNFLLRKCSLKAASLADEINLPSPIPIPRLPNQQK